MTFIATRLSHMKLRRRKVSHFKTTSSTNTPQSCRGMSAVEEHDHDLESSNSPFSSSPSPPVGDSRSQQYDNSRALGLLDKAMETLPSAEKAAYLEALEKAPQIVQTESFPVRFMRYEKENALAAAKRLAAYWEARKSLFGECRAFLPLHQTGDGALNDQDIEILHTGALCILPRNGAGQPVLFFDRSKLSQHMMQNPSGRLRTTFYMLHIAMEADTSLSAGVAVVALLVKPPNVGYDYEMPLKLFSIVQNALPITISSLHLVSLSSLTGRGHFGAYVTNAALQLLGNTQFGQIARIHYGDTAEDVFKTLKKHKFHKKGLPDVIGGIWTIEKFQNWLRRRHRAEEDMILTDNEKMNRKRKANMFHSKQKRIRRKIEYEVLQKQAQRLWKQNEGLRKTKTALEGLLEAANREVLAAETEELRGIEPDPIRLAETNKSTTTIPRAQLLGTCNVINEHRANVEHKETATRSCHEIENRRLFAIDVTSRNLNEFLCQVHTHAGKEQLGPEFLHRIHQLQDTMLPDTRERNETSLQEYFQVPQTATDQMMTITSAISHDPAQLPSRVTHPTIPVGMAPQQPDAGDDPSFDFRTNLLHSEFDCRNQKSKGLLPSSESALLRDSQLFDGYINNNVLARLGNLESYALNLTEDRRFTSTPVFGDLYGKRGSVHYGEQTTLNHLDYTGGARQCAVATLTGSKILPSPNPTFAELHCQEQQSGFSGQVPGLQHYATISNAYVRTSKSQRLCVPSAFGIQGAHTALAKARMDTTLFTSNTRSQDENNAGTAMTYATLMHREEHNSSSDSFTSL